MNSSSSLGIEEEVGTAMFATIALGTVHRMSDQLLIGVFSEQTTGITKESRAKAFCLAPANTANGKLEGKPTRLSGRMEG